jgi:serine/threonine-protein kinase BUR1
VAYIRWYSITHLTLFLSIGPETCDLIDKLLTCNPRERITASQALDHDYFWSDPLPADPRSCVLYHYVYLLLLIYNIHRLPVYEASHEFDKRGRRQVAMPPAAPHRPEPPSRPHIAPTQPPPLHFGRPPPPRESFRNGAPPSHHHSRGPTSYPSALAPPTTLPPLVLRPGQPLPAMYQHPIAFPPHLPARPPSPTRGNDRAYRMPRPPREDYGGLNYG